MQNNPFETLGVTDSVSQNELFEAYRNKRNEYLDKRFAPGEEGEKACEKLDEIETAYREADRILKDRIVIEDPQDSYEDIEKLIKDGQIEEAQNKLDNMRTRSAEWHFAQSMIYYKKGWLNDAKAQLKEATEIEPSNEKYSDAYKKLEAKTDSKHQHRQRPARSFYDEDGVDGQDRSYRDSNVDYDGENGTGCTPCDCCSSLLCANCLCNGCGGCCR